MTAAAALVVAGAAVGAASSSTGSAPTGLCLAEGSPVTAARSDGAGGWTCPSGRTLAVVAAQEAVRALQASADDLGSRLANAEGLLAAHGYRLDDGEQRLSAAEERAGVAEDRLGSAESRLTGAENELGSARQRLVAVESRLATLETRTALTTRSEAVTFAGSTVRRTVSCGTGKALSGSARVTESAVVQSAVTDDGAGWAFEVKPTGKAPQATLLVVCAGAPGTAPPPPGGVTGPDAPAPGTSGP